MSSPNSGDLLLVNRGGANYQIDYNDMSTLQDTDLLLVNRGGTNYQLAAVDLDLKTGSIGSPVEVLTPVDGAGVGGSFNYTPKTDTITDISTILKKGPVSFTDMGFSSSQSTPIVYVELPTGRIVALSEQDGIAYSDDNGLNYTSVMSPGNQWQNMVYEPVSGNIVVVGITSSSNTMYSTNNGETWNQGTQPSNVTFYDLATNGTGRIVASGQAGSSNTTPRYYSDNGGVSWSACTPTNDNYNQRQYRPAIAYGNGRFVTGPDWSSNGSRNAHAEYSTNGITWYSTNSGEEMGTRSIIYAEDKNLFVAIGERGNYYLVVGWSANGSSWTWHTIGSGDYQISVGYHPTALVYGNGLFIYGTPNHYGYRYSTDLTNWNLGTLPLNSSYNRVHGGTFVKNSFYMSDRYGSQTVWKGDDQTSYGSNPSFGNNSNDPFITYTFSFASTNVYNNSTGEIVEGADFDSVFDGNLIYWQYPNDPIYGFSDGGQFVTEDSDARFAYAHESAYMYRNGEVTQYGPSPTDSEFTSQNAGTTPVSASDATLAFRKWTLETRASSSDPWTLVVEADDYSPVGSQNGSTPWATKPTLQPNTQYRVKVAYYSSNAREVVSDYSYFTTGNS